MLRVIKGEMCEKEFVKFVKISFPARIHPSIAHCCARSKNIKYETLASTSCSLFQEVFIGTVFVLVEEIFF